MNILSKKSLLFSTDSYKSSHYLQYPPGMIHMFDYVEARRSIPEAPEMVMMGVEAFKRCYLDTPITEEDVNEAETFFTEHGVPFNYLGWQEVSKLKHLPISITTIPEGSKFTSGTPIAMVYNTKPGFHWLVSYVETALLRSIWYPTTVATISYAAKKIIAEFMLKTCDNLSGIDFKLHDFGARGVSSSESAALGGMAHLINFKGTDTVEALMAVRELYPISRFNPLDSRVNTAYHMPGFSIPAAEHSTITSWGKDREEDAYRNMVNQFGDTSPLYAVVSDSYDIYNAVEKIWGERLLEEVKQKKGTLVVRPDSGDPVTVVCKVLEILAAKFGFSVNQKGYKLLNGVRVIQGDGVNLTSIREILDKATSLGFSADNLAFGMGGGLLQKVNRDTLSFAMKSSAALFAGEKSFRPFSKNPATDSSKRSKAGIVYPPNPADGEPVSGYLSHPQTFIDRNNQLHLDFEMKDRWEWTDGKMYTERTMFNDIRAKAAAGTPWEPKNDPV